MPEEAAAALWEALADTFPVGKELVGEEFFGAMAGLFVRAHPPASPLMQRYGGRLPDFIEAFAPARGKPCTFLEAASATSSADA